MLRMPGHIVAMGGHVLPPDEYGSRLEDHLLSLAAAPSPHVVYLPTATGDDEAAIERFEASWARRDCTTSIARTFGIPERPADLVARADVVVVGGGSTANMLAVWRVHGVDRALRAVWERGGVLGGVSAGGNCWFEASVTDSFSIELDGLADGLGFLEGSFCPHFDGQEQRRPVYRRLVGAGFPAGIACDDGAGAVFHGTELVEIVAEAEGALGYRVRADGIEPLPARLLP